MIEPKLSPRLHNLFADYSYLLDLEDDWDHEGAKAVSAQDWNTAQFILASIEERLSEYPSFELPTLSLCADGTVDLWWSWRGDPVESRHVGLINVCCKIPVQSICVFYHPNQRRVRGQGIADTITCACDWLRDRMQQSKEVNND